jgi:hypothetical protein
MAIYTTLAHILFLGGGLFSIAAIGHTLRQALPAVRAIWRDWIDGVQP